MNIDGFLSRLEKVKKTPSGWLACCPAHDDRTPSLRVGIARSGGLLVHCFGGCAVDDVVAAVGLQVADLMPDSRPDQPFKRERLPAMDVLKALSFHATLIAICACDMSKGKTLSESDKETLLASAAAIHEAYGMVA